MFVRSLSLRLFTSAFTLLGIATSGSSFADQILLKTGGKLSGKIFPSKEDGMVVIKTDDGTAIQIAKEDVAKETKSTVVSIDYEALLKQTPDTAEGHKELALKCRMGGMSELGKSHYERVVELDPDDKTSWSAINYTYDERYGGWIRKAEQNFREEMGVYDRQVMTLHSKAIMTKKEEADKERVALEKTIKNEIAKLKKRDKDSVSAAEFLQGVKNPVVITFLEKQLMEELKRGVNGNPEIYMQMLLQMPGLSATKVFIRLAMNTNVPNYIVDQSLEALNRYDLSRDIAASDFIGALGSNPKALYKSQAEFDAVVQRIDRAARNLQSLPSEVAIVALINALTTTGNIVQQRQQNAGIDSSGGAGLTTPGSVAIPVSYNHESVLFALQEITKVNHSYNKEAWRIWFAQTYAKTNLDLRRIE